MINPIESIQYWMQAAGHENKTALYAALTIEEAKEVLDCLWSNSTALNCDIETAALEMNYLSGLLRKVQGEVQVERAELLDAALDTAWVALCMAYTIAGTDLPKAWAELHRSNVTDKQVDGVFQKDAGGKITKPDGWRPPNFEQFVKE